MSETPNSLSAPFAPTSEQQVRRLYIAPFAPELLSTILPPSLQSVAKDISYHAPQTFPEKPFGFVTISAPNALKLKSKLNGSFLKGIKMRVEEARPEKASKRRTRQTIGSGDADVDVASDTRVSEESKQSGGHSVQIRSHNGLLPAIELPAGRTVKRGWKNPGAKIDKKKPKHDRAGQEQEEQTKGQMVFRSKAASDVTSPQLQSKHYRGSKRSSRSGDVVDVTEFAATSTFPSFLRQNNPSATPKRAAEFVEGRGWVDEDDNIIETVDLPRKRLKKAEPEDHHDERERETVTPDTAIPSKEDNSLTIRPEELPILASDTDDRTTGPRNTASITPAPFPHATPHSSEGVSSPEAKVGPKEVHPLEALFKRPAPKSKSTSKSTAIAAPRPAPIKTSFSFFSSDDVADEPGDQPFGSSVPPQTPFTRRDMEMRGIRSAAPTPDTAALGERFRMPWRRSTTEGTEDSTDKKDSIEPEDDINTEDNINESQRSNKGKSISQNSSTGLGIIESSPGSATETDQKDTEQNEFEKHFWQHRAEYNRAWKARKKEARKQVRQTENRKRGSKRG